MDKFVLYAKYYDLLNSDKNYQNEINYVHELISKNSLSVNTKVLDLGCGTGIHANLLTKLAYQVDGVDLSAEMILNAKENYESNEALKFYESDITSFENGESYDVVLSLFHVMSYQNTNTELINSFKTAHKHLKTGGLFIFDFWYGPGVLTDLPEKRTKVLEDTSIHLKRKATPKMKINENVVDVFYEIDILDKSSNEIQTINEKHSMRYFFIKELEFYLKNVGFEMLSYYEWMTLKVPDTNSWNVVVVAKKDI